MRESSGVMELWSNDKDLFKLKFGVIFFHHSNTPVLQYSKAARHLYRQAHLT